MKFPEFLSFKGFCIAGKTFSNVYLTLFFQGLIDLSNKGYFLYMNLVCMVS